MSMFIELHSSIMMPWPGMYPAHEPVLMTIARLLLEYVQVLVWPGVVVWGIWLFRGPITKLLARIKRANLPGGLSIDLAHDVLELQRLSRQVEKEEVLAWPEVSVRPPPDEINKLLVSLSLKPSPSGLDMSYYADLAETNPMIAIAGLRVEIEIMVNNMAAFFKLDDLAHMQPRFLLKELAKRGLIMIEHQRLGDVLLRIGNAAIHGVEIPKAFASDVIEPAGVFARYYYELLAQPTEDEDDHDNK